MKKLFFILFLSISYFAQAQKVSELLSNKSWVFDSVFTQDSKPLNAKEQNFYKGLFRAAKYDFISSGIYTFDRPNVPQMTGKWELEDQDKFLFLMSDTGRGKRFKILEIKENRLVLEDLSSKTAVAYKHEE